MNRRLSYRRVLNNPEFDAVAWSLFRLGPKYSHQRGTGKKKGDHKSITKHRTNTKLNIKIRFCPLPSELICNARPLAAESSRLQNSLSESIRLNTREKNRKDIEVVGRDVLNSRY